MRTGNIGRRDEALDHILRCAGGSEGVAVAQEETLVVREV